MSKDNLSNPSELPRYVDYAKDASGKTYYIDHTTQTRSYIHPTLAREMPPNFECRIDSTSGKTYFVDHSTRTTSMSHPRHEQVHRPFDYDITLQYPHKQCLNAVGRHFYENHETKTTSWLHPIRLAELKAADVLDRDGDDLFGESGQAWKEWILEDVAECGVNREMSYFVDYRSGDVDWPESRE